MLSSLKKKVISKIFFKRRIKLRRLNAPLNLLFCNFEVEQKIIED